MERFFKSKFRRTASSKSSDSQQSTTQTAAQTATQKATQKAAQTAAQTAAQIAKPVVSEGLHRLFPTDECQTSPSGRQEYPVDIIAVHGLNGDAYSTWTHKPDGTLWLRDLLPSALPGCRVYTYSYPSKVFSESFARVHDFSRRLLIDIRDLHEGSKTGSRPIIFVCHSLGGIVFKQALVLAHQQDRLYGQVLRSVLGVAFLGTPHRGSDVASFTNVIGTIINAFKATATAGSRPRAIRADLLEHLSSHSHELRELITTARGHLENLAVVSFHELNPTSSLSLLIVDRASATLGIANEELIPMYEDHKSICRFPSETQSYKKIANAIRRIASQSPNLSSPLQRASTHSSNRSLSEIERACVKLLHQGGHLDQDDEKPKPLKPLPGTCQWIYGHKLFVSFLEKADNDLLWLTGHPGCGKTTLSFSLSQHFEENSANKKSLSVLTYFCTNTYSKQTDGREVLIGLIFQIINRHRSLISHVRRVFEVQGQSMIQSFSSLWNIFLKIVKDLKAGTLYVILDALDECEKKSCKQLLGAISDMLTESIRSNNTRVKFLITTRPFLHQTYARSVQVLQQHISIDDGQTGYVADLERFIQQRVEEISLSRQYPSNVKEYLLDTMRTKAGQTFLWIHIVLASVEESLLSSISDFRNIIASIPNELADTYRRYLSAIPDGHQTQASHFIKLLLASSRPLELRELNIAFSIKDSHSTTEEVELGSQTAFSHAVQGILGPLARVHESQVSLVHQSLKEFLLDTVENPGGFCATHAVNEKDSALQMAFACIQYLLLDDFEDDLFSMDTIPNLDDGLPEDDFGFDFWDEEQNLASDFLFHDPAVLNPKICDSLSSKYGFYNYASLHWAEHFALCEESASGRLRDAAMELLDVEKGSCRNWLQFRLTQSVNFLDDGTADQHPLVLAAYLNLQTTMKYLLGSGTTSQTIKNRSLFWASQLGHDQIVATLLTAGADPNSREGQQQCPLTAASEHGSLACVIALLADERTDINGGGRGGRSALSFACSNGHDTIVKELLKRKDCIADHVDNSKATPFFWAVGGGHFTIISTLAKNPNVNINHQDKDGRTALSWAAGDEMDDVVGRLLKLPGIDANLKDKTGKSPLSWAADSGCATTVAVLLKSKLVDIFSTDETGRNAISWASGGGHYDSLVKLLVKGKLGADVEDTAGWTPLAWAIEKDSPRSVQALISTGGVEIERRDRSSKTALNWAVEYGHAPVVKVLLQAGANPDSKNYRGDSALSTAIRFGRLDLLEMLKEYSTEWQSD